MSGPAILKLSAFGARVLSELNYDFKIQVNWANEKNNEVIMKHLEELIAQHEKKSMSSVKPYALPQRLWNFMLEKCKLSSDKKWHELSKKSINRLVEVLSHDVYHVKGKTTFKEEFVTCGGVSLESVDLQTMRSKTCKDLYFVGELLDIDGITGGYNFQNAWTTAFVAGKLKN